MIELGKELPVKLREVRARKKLTLHETSLEIGISSKTLSLIENEKISKVKKTIYKKITIWLLESV